MRTFLTLDEVVDAAAGPQLAFKHDFSFRQAILESGACSAAWDGPELDGRGASVVAKLAGWRRNGLDMASDQLRFAMAVRTQKQEMDRHGIARGRAYLLGGEYLYGCFS